MKDTKIPLIEFTKVFNKQRKKAPFAIKIAFRDALDLFLDNPTHPSLRDHPLKDTFAGYRSIDITDDWRAIYKSKRDGEQEIIVFHMFGTHEKLYGM